MAMTSMVQRVLKLTFVGAALLASLPGNAASQDAFAGIWLVVPRLESESVAPGAIAKAYVLSEKDGRLQGSFRWGGKASPLSEVVVKEGLLTFRVPTLHGLHWRSAELSADGRKLRLWATPAPQGNPAWIAKRASLDELAAVERVAPRIRKHEKLPLPPLREVDGGALARTPPMGWNSWNHFAVAIDEKTVREIADALVESGLRDAGYVYVNIDDGWQGERGPDGVLQPNAKFPDMKALGEYLHARGLKFGLYSSPGTFSCGEYLGSHGFEEQDAKTFAAWGVDLLKYDWCSAELLYKTQTEMQALYQKMGEALRATGRPIVYSLCQYGLHEVGKWGRKVGGNLWRTTYDIHDSWESMSSIGFGQHGKEGDAGPGGWNDPDMLHVGNGGMSLEEYRTHMSLWSMLSAPLLLGNDIRKLTPEIKAIVANKEVIAIDQDALGKQGSRAWQQGETEVWTKPLADGSMAVAFFNRGTLPATMRVRWADLGIPGGRTARDLWKHQDLGRITERFEATVPAHGVVMLRVSAATAAAAAAKPLLDPLFQDHAVVQRGKPLKVWGQAPRGEKVSVSFGAASTSVRSDATGRWIATLPAMEAGGPHALSVRTSAGVTQSLQDILVGDVWLCSGQSNMVWEVKYALDAASEIRGSSYDSIRMLTVPRAISPVPRAALQGAVQWEPATPETVAEFSATCFFFARELQKSVRVPLGLVNASWSGSRIEEWMSEGALRAAGRYDAALDVLRLYATDAQAAERRWSEMSQAQQSRSAPRPPWQPGSSLTLLRNAMITPLGQYGFRGVVWYQGESNVDDAANYQTLLAGFMRDWRAQFGAELPFLIVQLANHGAPSRQPVESGWAGVREAQRRAVAEDARAGLAVAIDIGDRYDIHPPNKQEVGRRLARAARHVVYGEPIAPSGPVARRAQREGGVVVVEFEDVEEGLVTFSSAHPIGFELCGAQPASCHYATATIHGQRVAIDVPASAAPTRVRYCWANNPICTLFDHASLPAGPFELPLLGPQAAAPGRHRPGAGGR